jgi:hypothetical protein
MGYYYRCRIPPLGDEDASIAFDALQIGLSSALAEMLQIRGRTGFVPSPRRLALPPMCYHGRWDQLKTELQKSPILQ